MHNLHALYDHIRGDIKILICLDKYEQTASHHNLQSVKKKEEQILQVVTGTDFSQDVLLESYINLTLPFLVQLQMSEDFYVYKSVVHLLEMIHAL